MKSKIIYALLSVVIAFGLWAYVITVVSPESEATYYDIPVTLINESVLNDKGLMIVSEETPRVTLRLKGNRSDLNKLKNSDITLVADLSKINDPGNQTLSYTISYPGDFADNAFETLSYSPDRITLKIEEWSTKELPIEINCVGTVHADYIIATGGITQDYEKITITGPKSVIDEIVQARVDVDVEGSTATIAQSKRVTLCDAQGNPVDASAVQANVTEVNVGVRIQKVKVLNLVLNKTFGGGATEANTNIIVNYTTIKVAGSEQLLEKLGDTLVLGDLDVSQIKENSQVFTYNITLPEGIDNLSGVSTVTATVSFPGLATKELTLPVSSLMMINVPAGMQVGDIGTMQCVVVFRGPKALIESLTIADVMLQVDLTGASLGWNLFAAHITVRNPAMTSVGVVGTYDVSVMLEAVP